MSNEFIQGFTVGLILIACCVFVVKRIKRRAKEGSCVDCDLKSVCLTAKKGKQTADCMSKTNGNQSDEQKKIKNNE